MNNRMPLDIQSPALLCKTAGHIRSAIHDEIHR